MELALEFVRLQVSQECLRQRNRGGLWSFQVGRVTCIAKSLASDGSDGGPQNPRRQSDLSGLQKRKKVRRRR